MKVAVVTGANKGIGLEIAKKIGAAGYKTILACRTESLGKEAERNLQGLGYDVEFRQLDVGKPAGFGTFVASLERDFGKVDVLVNNAAIAFLPDDPTPANQQARPVFNVNYFGTLKFTDAMLPLLKKAPSPKLINVASSLGHLTTVKDPATREKFARAETSLTFPELEVLVNQYIADSEAGKVPADILYADYSMSKVALIAATKILARQEPNVAIYSCCPGYCDTDLNGHKGPRSAEHGARTPAMLALTSVSGPNGRFFYDEAPVDW